MKLLSGLRKVYSAVVLAAISFSVVVIAAAQSEQLPKTVLAPVVRQLSRAMVKRIGSCDKVLASPETDSLFILRGAKLSQLSMIEPYGEKLVGENESFVGQTLETTFAQNGHTYVLFSSIELSKTSHPFLYDIGDKKIFPLAPYGLGPFSKDKDRLFGHVSKMFLYVHGNGMLYLLSLAAPAEDAWCWIDLATGRIEIYPGRQLNYTDVAGRIAVFSYYKDGVDIPAFGIDIDTGKTAYSLPAKFKTHYSDRSNLHPRPVMTDPDEHTHDSVIGVSVGTEGFYRALFPEDSHSVERIDASDTFAALRVKYSDRVKNETDDDESLWVMPLRNGIRPKRVCYYVQDFAMLDGGYCVYSARTTVDAWFRDTAYMYNFERHQSWALLDGLEPPTPPDLKPYFVEAESDVLITPGFGRATNGRLAFAEIRQFYFDKRDVSPLTGVLATQIKLWKFFLVSSQGNRYEIRIPKDVEDTVLVHNQGALILQIPHDSGDGFDLELFQFKLPRE